jgi:endonuclease YncB( thermonuclease family)
LPRACAATQSASCSSAAEPSARAWQAHSLRILLALLLLVSGMPAVPADAVLAGRVTRVIDGDTLDVLLATGRIRVRLHGVDAPERSQSGGNEATQWLRQQVLNQDVLLEPVSQDRYERMVAIVYAGDVIVNRELLRTGTAWAYRHYLRGADRLYCDIEATARAEHRGLWRAGAAHAPWEYRRTAGRGPFTDYSRQSARDCWRLRKKT